MRLVLIRYIKERWGCDLDYPFWLYITVACLIFVGMSFLSGVVLVAILPSLHYILQDRYSIYFGMAFLVGVAFTLGILLFCYLLFIAGRYLWGTAFPTRLLLLEESGDDETVRILPEPPKSP